MLAAASQVVTSLLVPAVIACVPLITNAIHMDVAQMVLIVIFMPKMVTLRPLKGLSSGMVQQSFSIIYSHGCHGDKTDWLPQPCITGMDCEYVHVGVCKMLVLMFC